jgi:hypothetical protein
MVLKFDEIGNVWGEIRMVLSFAEIGSASKDNSYGSKNRRCRS